MGLSLETGLARRAILSVNGRDLPIQQGGYDGFRWLRVPVPAAVTPLRWQSVHPPCAALPIVLTQLGEVVVMWQ